MKKPSAKQIKAEIETLKAMKPTVVKESVFGENHWNGIAAQIHVLTERMTEDEAEDHYEDGSYAQNVISDAIDAALWLAGESEDGAPSKEWKCLVRK